MRFVARDRIIARDGEVITAKADHFVEALAGSRVYALRGSRIEALQGATVYAYNGSEVIARDGSEIRALSGSRVMADADAHVKRQNSVERTGGHKYTLVAQGVDRSGRAWSSSFTLTEEDNIVIQTDSPDGTVFSQLIDRRASIVLEEILYPCDAVEISLFEAGKRITEYHGPNGSLEVMTFSAAADVVIVQDAHGQILTRSSNMRMLEPTALWPWSSSSPPNNHEATEAPWEELKRVALAAMHHTH